MEDALAEESALQATQQEERRQSNARAFRLSLAEIGAQTAGAAGSALQAVDIPSMQLLAHYSQLVKGLLAQLLTQEARQ